MFIALSAVDKNSVKAFCKLAILVGMSFEFEYKAETRRLLNQWLVDSEPFLKRFKFPRKELNAAVRALVAQADPNKDQKLDDAITEIMYQIADLKKDFHAELDIPKVELDVLDRIRLYSLKGSENALKYIAKNISYFKEPTLNKMFVEEVDDTSDIQTKLKKLVGKYADKPGMIMPAEQLSKFVEHNKSKGQRHKDHDDYLKLRRELMATYKKRLAGIVRDSGKHYLPLREVIKTLDSEKVYHELPKEFVGNIDDQGAFYTTEGKKIAVTISGSVRMNPAYDPKTDNAYVCEYQPAFAQNTTRAYTVDFKKERVDKKFDVVKQVAGKLETLTSKWLKDMRKAPKTRESCMAMICELCYETTARIGNVNAKTDGKSTYGVTQWRIRHITKFSPSGMEIKYPGKSGVVQHHKIKFNTPRLRMLGDKLEAFIQDKEKDEYLISFKGQAFTSAMINRYLLYLGFPQGFTIHKLRTSRGTTLAYNILQASPFKKGADPKEVNAWVERELIKVGEELGHISGEKVTVDTAIQNYIDPSILDDFFRNLGIRPSAKIQKAIDAKAPKD